MYHKAIGARFKVATNQRRNWIIVSYQDHATKSGAWVGNYM